jgi:hypothetical protein
MSEQNEQAATAVESMVGTAVAALPTVAAPSNPAGFDKLTAGMEQFTASVEKSFSRVSEDMTAFNIKAVDILRENVNSTFELWEQMIGARTFMQAIELQTSHAQKRAAALGEQSQSLSALAQSIAQNSFDPMRNGWGSIAARH